LKQIEDAFHAEHERQFGYRREEMPVEFLHWRAAAVGRMELEHGEGGTVAAETPAEPIGERRVHVPALGEVAAVPLFKVEDLATGSRVDGPAVVAGDTTTILLEPGDLLRCDEEDSFLIEIAGVAARGALASATPSEKEEGA
jgi:N-methylhydantoinase A